MVSLTDREQCIQMGSIDASLDYDSTVMLTCKVLAAAKAIVDIVLICPGSHKLCLLDFLQDQDVAPAPYASPPSRINLYITVGWRSCR